MDKQKILKIGILGFLLIALADLVAVLVYILLTRAAPNALDLPLNPGGEAYEINRDDMGRLWISDFSSHEVWGIDPTNGTYEVYPVSGSPVDARQAGGWLWWATGVGNILGRVSTNDGSYTEWQVPDAPGFLSTNLDDQGRLYATDSSNPYLYRQDAEMGQLCTYSLPGYGAGNYIVRYGRYLWVDNFVDSIIIRFQIDSDSLTWWSLPAGSSPFGMAVDGQGNLWYADSGSKAIAQLDPNTSQLTVYPLPIGNQPMMITVQSNEIWFTEQSQSNIVRLDPVKAEHSILPLTANTQPLTPDCVSSSPSNSGKVTITRGQLNWSENTYPAQKKQSGWQIYQMPENSKPQGIALKDNVYVVDWGRQMLIHFQLVEEAPPVLARISAIAPTPTPVSKPIATSLQVAPPTSTSAPAFIPTVAPSSGHSRTYLPLIYRNDIETP